MLLLILGENKGDEDKTSFKDDIKNNVAKISNEVNSFVKNIGDVTSLFKPKGTDKAEEIKQNKTKKRKKKKNKAKFMIDEDDAEGEETTTSPIEVSLSENAEAENNPSNSH